MKRFRILAAALVALSFLALPAHSAAAGKTKLLANSVVKTVTPSALTVTADGKDTTFTVDPKTKVIGKGIGTKAAAKGGKASISDLLSAGDKVAVSYEEAGGAMHASKVQLLAK